MFAWKTRVTSWCAMSTWAGCQRSIRMSKSERFSSFWYPVANLTRLIDYYGVTFDHLVPADDTNPEVLQINIIEVEDDNGVYANTWLLFSVDLAEFIGKKVLAVPRCCQKRKGTQDRWRVNALVDQRVHGWENLRTAKELERCG
jgi:hypothetical protein